MGEHRRRSGALCTLRPEPCTRKDTANQFWLKSFSRSKPSHFEMSLALSIETADPSDMNGVLSLLAASDLTPAGLAEEAAVILVARKDGAIVACAALKTDGSDALLRSVAVAETERGRGLGIEVVGRIESQARQQGVTALYLLTTTAEGFFRKMGYAVIDRSDVPSVVRTSAEFSACASAGATAMVRHF